MLKHFCPKRYKSGLLKDDLKNLLCGYIVFLGLGKQFSINEGLKKAIDVANFGEGNSVKRNLQTFLDVLEIKYNPKDSVKKLRETLYKRFSIKESKKKNHDEDVEPKKKAKESKKRSHEEEIEPKKKVKSGKNVLATKTSKKDEKLVEVIIQKKLEKGLINLTPTEDDYIE